MTKLRPRRLTRTVFVAIFLAVLALPVPAMAKRDGVTIQDGILKYRAEHYLAGQPLKVGYDIFGYNYQAHLFKGPYANVYLGADGFPPYEGDDAAYLAANPKAATKWYWPYRHDSLVMKWNDAWIANTDRDGDGLLDRHYGYPSYIGSGAWETNHITGEDESGHYTYFCKIVAAPADAELVDGNWVTADGDVIGYEIWGEFAVTLETGTGGLLYKGDAAAGFGRW